MREVNDIEELLDKLSDMIQKGFTIPLGQDKCVIDRDKAIGFIDEIRHNLPDDLRAARNIVAERNSLMAAARKDSEQMMKRAEESARKMVEQQEVLQTAKRLAGDVTARTAEECKRMVNAAEIKAVEITGKAESRSKEIQRMAKEFLDSALKRTEDVITSSLTDVRRTREEFKKIK